MYVCLCTILFNAILRDLVARGSLNSQILYIYMTRNELKKRF